MTLFLVVTLVTLWRLRRPVPPPDLLRRGEILLAVLVAQGALGYLQYFTGVPVVLVGFHIFGAAAVWVAVLRFHLALSVPVAGPMPGPAIPWSRGRQWVGLDIAMTTAPVEVKEPEIEEVVTPDRPWIVIVWNDPINLMTYVTFVFQKLFGYSLEKATKLMLDVHEKGRAVVSSGPREKAELDVFRLHEHGLWATMEHDS